MTSLGLGLIGLGRHGQRYARHLLEGIPHCQLVAVCRRDASKGQRFAKQHGLRFYQDPQDLITDPHVQAILVVTPPAEAIRIAIQTIRHNKPLLIEKPMGCTAFDAQRVVKEAAQAKTPLMVAHTLRYEDAIIQLKHHGATKIGKWQYLVLTNRLESPSDLDSTRSSHRRGTLLEIGIHQLDMVRFLTGQEVSQVYCEMDRHPSQGPDVRAWVTLKTEAGLACLLDVSRMSNTRVTRAEIIGETGQLIADWTSNTLLRMDKNGTSTAIPLTPEPTIPRVIADFVQAIQAGTPLPITGLDGLRAVEMVDACYESANTRKTVVLKPH